MLTQNTDNMLMINISSIVKTITSNKKVLQMFLIIETIVISLLLFITRKTKNIYYSEQVELTPKIKVPKPIGQGQYGTGWWLNKKDYSKYDKASSSMSLISRKLLTPDEVLMIENPYALVMVTGKPPAITTIPDISKMHFNKINGMGSKEHNQKLRIERENTREERPIKPIKIWNIWDKQTEEEMPRMKVEVIQDNFRKNLKGK
jgi:hypothetical protein